MVSQSRVSHPEAKMNKSMFHVVYRMGFVRRHVDVLARDEQHAVCRLLRERPTAIVESVECDATAVAA